MYWWCSLRPICKIVVTISYLLFVWYWFIFLKKKRKIKRVNGGIPPGIRMDGCCYEQSHALKSNLSSGFECLSWQMISRHHQARQSLVPMMQCMCIVISASIWLFRCCFTSKQLCYSVSFSCLSHRASGWLVFSFTGRRWYGFFHIFRLLEKDVTVSVDCRISCTWAVVDGTTPWQCRVKLICFIFCLGAWCG